MNPLDLARICAQAYKDRTWHAAGSEALLLNQQGNLVLAFRGTTSVSDWLDNFEAIPFYDSQLGFVHRGFISGAAALFKIIRAHNLDNVYLTGHSKGGAEATLFAAKLAVQGATIASLTTFGSPRAGFTLRKILQNIPTFRYVHGIDAIPNHPWPLWGYRHVGAKIPLRSPAPNAIKDHLISNYIKALENEPYP